MRLITIATILQGIVLRAPAQVQSAGGTMHRMAIDTKGTGDALVLVGGGVTGWQSWIPHQERLASSRRVSRAQPVVVQLGLDQTPLPSDYSVRLESRAVAAGFRDAGTVARSTSSPGRTGH